MALQLGHFVHKPSGTVTFFVDPSVLMVLGSSISNQLIAYSVMLICDVFSNYPSLGEWILIILLFLCALAQGCRG